MTIIILLLVSSYTSALSYSRKNGKCRLNVRDLRLCLTRGPINYKVTPVQRKR